MKKLVILGGGYGGLTIAHSLLEKDTPDDISITLVDRMPYQGLKTEYYALAAGTVSDIAVRVSFPSDPRIALKYGEVTEVSLEQKEVIFENGETMAYDWLIIALGCVDKYHNIPGAQTYSNSIQTLSDTRITYQRINDVAPYGQVSIIGGGLSGVEIAAELRESRPDLNIRTLDRGPSVLSAFPAKAQKYVREWFQEHDIEMITQAGITHLEKGVIYNRGDEVLSDVVVWTAGIQPSPIVQKLNVEKDPQGRVILDAYHQIPTNPGVFVVGDCASLPFSPSAQAAEGQGKQVAEVLKAIWKGETPKLGLIKLKGVLGSLGKKCGFGLMGKSTVMTGKVPRAIKSGVLWMSKNHFG